MISDSKSFCEMTFVLSFFQLEQMLTIEKKGTGITQSSSQQKICFSTNNGLLVLMSKKIFSKMGQQIQYCKLTNYGFERSTTKIWQVQLEKKKRKKKEKNCHNTSNRVSLDSRHFSEAKALPWMIPLDQFLSQKKIVVVDVFVSMNFVTIL